MSIEIPGHQCRKRGIGAWLPMPEKLVPQWLDSRIQCLSPLARALWACEVLQQTGILPSCWNDVLKLMPAAQLVCALMSWLMRWCFSRVIVLIILRILCSNRLTECMGMEVLLVRYCNMSLISPYKAQFESRAISEICFLKSCCCHSTPLRSSSAGYRASVGVTMNLDHKSWAYYVQHWEILGQMIEQDMAKCPCLGISLAICIPLCSCHRSHRVDWGTTIAAQLEKQTPRVWSLGDQFLHFPTYPFGSLGNTLLPAKTLPL